MKATFVRQNPVTDHIISFWFQPDQPVHYTAGQFTELKLPHEHVDERGDKRWFTLSSSPTDKLLSITTKFSQPGSSFKRTLRQLAPGTKLHLADPMGDFVLPKDPTIPLIFVAGGMGITPIHSMIQWLTDTHDKRQITLLYATTEVDELIFLPLFEKYGLHLITLSREHDGDKALITAAGIIDMTRPTANSRLYLSGPEPMIESLVDEFNQTAISSDQLVTDYFPGYPVI